jgi:lysophospholipase L1-like esterase
LDTTNAACPGETSASFMSPTGADNGCRAIRARPFPLHVSYPSTQQAFAESFLTTHKQTQLVTISLGSNDLVLLVLSCNFDATCINAGLDTLTLNMGKILQDLRGRFRGVLMVVNYYSPDTSETPLIQLLNGRLAKAASENGAVLADVFTAFGGISGNPCETGLLNVKPETPPPQMFQPLCDVHPSQSGHQLIADTIEATYKAAIPGH